MAQPQFEFRLEALLAHRLQVEKEKQRKVAGIQQQIQTLIAELQEYQRKIAEEDRSLSAAELTGRLDMQYISHEKRYVGALHMKIVLGMQKAAAMEKTLNAARAELLEAARSRKVIEKLKEKQLARWRLEIDRREAALMDEIGTQLARRNAEAARAESGEWNSGAGGGLTHDMELRES